MKDLIFGDEIRSEIVICECSDCLDNSLLEEIKPNLVGDGQCFVNAKLVSRLTGALCVEGVVQVHYKNDTSFIRHCWNMISDKHFDITGEFKWPQNGYVAYYPFVSYELEEYDNLKLGQNFLSNVVDIAKKLNNDYGFKQTYE